MKILHLIVALALALFLVVLSAFLIASAFDAQIRFVAFLGHPTGRLMLGGALLFITLLYGLSAIPVGRGEDAVSFTNEGGSVSISKRAVSDYLCKLMAEIPGIAAPHAVLTGDKVGEVDVLLDLAVEAGVKVHELSEKLQQTVRNSLRDGLGISEVGSVKIRVREIRSKPEAESAPPRW